MSSAALAPTGIKGFDCNAFITTLAAHAFFAAGYRFAMRYIPRLEARLGDLTAAEVEAIHNAGLAVGIVQHVESDKSWVPSADKGKAYGDGATRALSALSVPFGTTVWLDLEGVAFGTPHEQIIQYVNYWSDRVSAARYQPGLYVGWRAMLSPDELYARLKVTRYWAAYNENTDQLPVTRGVCMSQHAAKAGDKPKGVLFDIDTDFIAADRLGGLPTLWAPDEWAV